AIRLITYALPARYFVALLQTIFLAGDVWEVILPNAAVLAGMAVGFLLLTRGVTRKELAWGALCSRPSFAFSRWRARNWEPGSWTRAGGPPSLSPRGSRPLSVGTPR